MAIVSAPPERMTETAAGLLAAAAALGYPATAVITTGDTPLGLGFLVPDEVAEKWLGPGAPTEDLAPEVPEPEVPEPHGPQATEPKAPRKRGPSKPVTDGPEV